MIAKSYDSHRNFAHLDYNKWPYNKYFLQIERVTSTTTPAEVEAWVDQATSQNLWLIVVFHEVNPNGIESDEWGWTNENLTEVLNYLNTKNIKLKTVADMLKHGDNLVVGGNFDQGLTTGWWTNSTSTVTVDTNANGAYPEATNSVKIDANPLTAEYIHSPLMDIDPAQLYGIRFYVNARDLVSGEVQLGVDEYDAAGNWISFKNLGRETGSWVIDAAYSYTATSANVSKVSLQAGVAAGSIGTAYIDSVEFFKPQ
jgi:hypothetical protein